MNARKTEYRGITFASKAEARLALFLDDQGKAWWYEPETLRLPDGYVPDFVLMELRHTDTVDDGSIDTNNFLLSMYIIEYKPRRPTKTYIDELSVRFQEIGNRLHSESTLDAMLCSVVNLDMAILVGGMGYQKAESLALYWDSPHHPKASVAKQWEPSWGWPLIDIDPDEVNQRLSSYRFDLQHEEHHA